MENYLIDEKETPSIQPLYIGWECCEKNHTFGPYVRDCYLIHFCLSGRGTLINSQGEHGVERGSFFVIRPGEITTYRADDVDPWEYTWIGFRADNLTCFDCETSVYDTPENLDEKLLHLVKSNRKSTEGCLAIIYELIFKLSEYDEPKNDVTVIRQVRRYIKYNYMLPLTVNKLARDFGFERSYLFRIFKARYGMGIKEYLTDVRMKMGAQLLSEGYSVKESAQMVGYEDRFHFSKAYKSYFGINPSETKNNSKMQ